MKPRPDALVLDLDGVLRHFDPAVRAPLEAAASLDAGTILAVAFDHRVLNPVLVGKQSHEEWAGTIAEELTHQHQLDPDAARALVTEWMAYRGEIDPDVLRFVAEVRAAGVPVALATNATSRLDADLELLGVADAFDVVVNSSVVGAHKPSREFFAIVCDALRRSPAHCLFVDDDDRNVRGARAAGLSAYRWNGVADLPYLRAALGL
ncbi:HAD-IA family hydrolase [Luedemannella helvata]|uniref:Haloacid dehalogenase n=1 Tax=Luedemannella helvata TaxID=349315 RepID=A0ABP4WMD3_9ACTN